MSDEMNPINSITLFFNDSEEITFTASEYVILREGTAGNDTLFVIHEINPEGDIICSSVWPSPGNGTTEHIEILRGD